jgi:hypothetical protein
MTRPQTTRKGKTTTIRCGYATLDVTLNEWEGGGEVFAKYSFQADGAKDLIERAQKEDAAAVQQLMEALQAPQGYLDRLCTMASLAIQGRGDRATVARHLMGDKTWPRGTAGQPTSPIDAIGKLLQKKEGEETSYDRV